jgi:hypothetical protein
MDQGGELTKTLIIVLLVILILIFIAGRIIVYIGGKKLKDKKP